MIFEKIKQKILLTGITGKELNLLLIFLILLFAGLAIKSVKSMYPQYEKYDYSSMDSVFNALNIKDDSTDAKFIGKPDTIVKNELISRSNIKGKPLPPPNVKININSASASELVLLPGVGIKTAEGIISYRVKKGHFKSIEDLLGVKGIGPKKFEKIKDYITIIKN